MQNELHSSLCQIKMPTQNYVRAAVAPRSRASWKADCRDGGTVQWGLENQQGEGENTLNTASAMWLLNHNHRYLHLLRWKKLMLSDGVLMFNVQMSQPAQKTCFESWQLLELRSIMSETHLLSGGAFTTGAAVLVQFCQVSVVRGSTGWLQQYGKLGLHQNFAPGKAEPQVQFSCQSMKNQYTILTFCCGCCSTDHNEEQIESKVYKKTWCHINRKIFASFSCPER